MWLMISKSPGRPRKRRPAKPETIYRVCKNCPKKFEPTRDDHFFHDDQCRKEYHRHGHPNFGTMRDALLKEFRAIIAEHERRIAELEAATRLLISGRKDTTNV